MASMGSQAESNSPSSKTVYVALGNDQQEGLKTLDWTLRKWRPNNISKIVILHLALSDFSTNVVDTPFGKLPASSMSDEKLEALRNYEERKVDKLLSEYVAYCGKGVKTKVVKLENSDEQPVQRAMVELISKLKISTLVMGISFLKSSPSWKRTRNAIGALFYVHQKKPSWCEMWIVCGGKLVRVRGGESEEEGVLMEDEEGKAIDPSSGSGSGSSSSSSWLGRVFSENPRRKRSSSCSYGGCGGGDSWERNGVEIDKYLEELMMKMDGLNMEEAEIKEQRTIPSSSSSSSSSSTTTVHQEMEIIRSRIKEAERRIKEKRIEAEANAERSANAEWAISLCNSRVTVEELESRIKAEAAIRIELAKKLESDRERIEEVKSDLEESQNRARALAELQSELSNRLQMSTAARSAAEAQLQRKAMERGEVVREIEELRRQRDVLQRRIEFCKEKDAIGMAVVGDSSCNDVRFSYREYIGEDVRSATDDFSDGLRLKSGGGRSDVYRGRISQRTVAVKLFPPELELREFLSQVKFQNNIRHPHLVATMGFCSELKCIIYEYMHEGSLKDNLLGCSEPNFGSGNRTLKWFDRIRLANQVCSALAFLHSAKPSPIVYGKLTVSNVLLDRNLIAKLSGFGPSPSTDVQPDIRALGVILLHLLTGKRYDESVETRMRSDRTTLVELLDETAGPWPLGLAEELAGIAMRCLSTELDDVADVLEEMEELRKKGDDVAARFGRDRRIRATNGGDRDEHDDDESSIDVPGFFLCPILQDVMENPYVAADGISYEREAMEQWLRMGRVTSPMTNLRLDHTALTPNHILRSLIEEWHSKRNPESSSSFSSSSRTN